MSFHNIRIYMKIRDFAYRLNQGTRLHWVQWINNSRVINNIVRIGTHIMLPNHNTDCLGFCDFKQSNISVNNIFKILYCKSECEVFMINKIWLFYAVIYFPTGLHFGKVITVKCKSKSPKYYFIFIHKSFIFYFLYH